MKSAHLLQVRSENVLSVTQEGIKKIKVLNRSIKHTHIFFKMIFLRTFWTITPNVCGVFLRLPSPFVQADSVYISYSSWK